MKTKLFVALIISALCFWGCVNKKKDSLNSYLATHKVSNTYKTPSFDDSLRIQKLTDFIPVVDSIYEDYFQKNKISSIVYGFVVDDTLLASGGFGLTNYSNNYPATTKSLYRIASMTKSFTAMAILKLRDEGKISISVPVVNYIPELSAITYLTSDASLITIENLLTMTSGFPEDNPWADRQLDMPREELKNLLTQGFSLSNNPSMEYEYSNLGYAILGEIITQISGMPFQEYITNNILIPLGMNNTYWEYSAINDSLMALGYKWEDEKWTEEPILNDGSFGAIGGLITSIEDFSKYVSFQLSAMPPSNKPDSGPVNRSTLREMQTIRNAKLIPKWEFKKGEYCSLMYGYGYGLYTIQFCDWYKGNEHSGGLPGYGSHYFFLPDYGIGIISFCNTQKAPVGADDKVSKALKSRKLLQKRKVPVSKNLIDRKEMVVRLLQAWEPDLEGEILAENFYLDKSREKRIKETSEILNKVGKIISIGDITPENQLRGTFIINGELKNAKVFFSLTPEYTSKIQKLTIDIIDE